ncbi:neutral cholesterol ester hydrolase 1-like [Amphiura filiformis]|uniref:neutral cholesterol ester hydrolase 1-like n=1 Tax=Amphiura filiformis TaxID=82378 RepID=UPI003B211BB9
MSRVRSLLLAGVIAAVAYWLYTPVPDDIISPWKFRSQYAVMRFTQDVVLPILSIVNGQSYWVNLRQVIDSAAPDIPKTSGNIKITQTEFDGVKVLLYEPIKRGPHLSRGLIYIHGGGFVIGSTKLYHPLTLQLADELDMVVASIEYRLAPEHTFPAAHDDCVTVIKHFLRHLDEYGVDPARVAVAGDSGGGRLTGALMHHFRDNEKSLPKIKIQGMIYPSLQALDVNNPSRQLYKKNWGNGGLLTGYDSAMFLSLYLNGKKDVDFIEAMINDQLVPVEFRKNDVRYAKYLSHDLIPDSMRNKSFYTKPIFPDHVDETQWNRHKDALLDARYAPLVQHDLKNLPQAYIMTCEHDTLRDDGVMYYKRLQQAGVETKWVNYQAGYHGMINPIGNYPVAKIAVKDFIDYLRKEL